MKNVLGLTLAVLAAAGGTSMAQEKKNPQTVVFVCEHGAAKSVVAAAHFNKLAAEKGLTLRAISRGTDPEPEFGAVAVKGLAADGLTVSGKPQKLAPADVGAAKRVVALGCDVSKAVPGAKAEQWEVPPMSDGYEPSRKAIVENVRKLLAELEMEKRPAR